MNEKSVFNGDKLFQSMHLKYRISSYEEGKSARIYIGLFSTESNMLQFIIIHLCPLGIALQQARSCKLIQVMQFYKTWYFSLYCEILKM